MKESRTCEAKERGGRERREEGEANELGKVIGRRRKERMGGRGKKGKRSKKV